MLQIKTNFLVLASHLFLICCNGPAGNSEKNDKDTTKVVSISDTDYMGMIDAVVVN